MFTKFCIYCELNGKQTYKYLVKQRFLRVILETKGIKGIWETGT